MGKSMFTIKYRHHRHNKEEPSHCTEDEKDDDVTGKYHMYFLYYLISESIHIPSSEEEYDRTIRIFLVIFSDQLRCILESVSVLDGLPLCLLSSVFCLLERFDETLRCHPLDVFFFITREIYVRDDEL